MSGLIDGGGVCRNEYRAEHITINETEGISVLGYSAVQLSDIRIAIYYIEVGEGKRMHKEGKTKSY
jgi:hypothetical protein